MDGGGIGTKALRAESYIVMGKGRAMWGLVVDVESIPRSPLSPHTLLSSGPAQTRTLTGCHHSGFRA